MQKVLIGVLALVALYFAAAHARQGERLRILEARLRAAEARPRPRTVVPAPAESLAPPALPEQREAAPSLATTAVPRPAVPESAPASVASAAKGVRWELKGRVVDPGPVAQDLVLSNASEAVTEQAKRAVLQLVNVEMVELQQTLDLQHVDQVFSGQAEASSAGPRAGYLGVSASNAIGGGAQISQVMPDSAASSFGLQAGDVILDFNGEPVSDFAGLSAKIRATFEGTAVVLRINRGGSEMVQSVVMGGRR